MNPMVPPNSSDLDLWTRSDQYHNSFLLKPDAVLDAVARNTKEKGIHHEIAVSPAQGKFLHLLLLSVRAKRVLEVGSLGGYSAIWMARALPDDGQVVELELEKLHAQVIEENVANAGLSSKVKVIVGPALDSLKAIHPSAETPKFDLAFIDADKENNTNYFIEAKRLVRSGGIIIVDNVGWFGLPVDLHDTRSTTEGVRELLRYIKDDTEVEATTIHTAGERGFDGFLYAFRK